MRLLRIFELQSFPLQPDVDFAPRQVLARTRGRHIQLSTLAKLWFAAGCGQSLPPAARLPGEEVEMEEEAADLAALLACRGIDRE